MINFTQKDCMHCLTCVAFAVFLNLVVPYLMKMTVKSPNKSFFLGRMADNVIARAEHPVESSFVLAIFVFTACCLGKCLPLFK